jgi:hypothetical protein
MGNCRLADLLLRIMSPTSADRSSRWRVMMVRVALGLMLLGTFAPDLRAKDLRSARAPGQVYLFRGVFGIDGGISVLRNEILRRGIPATAYDPGEWGAVAGAIATHERAARQHAPVALIGYSLGAHDAISLSYELGQAGIPVDLLVTLDAPDPLPVPANVRQVLNLYQTRAGFVRGQPVTVAASFSGHLINRDLASLPDIEHNDFVRRPEVLAWVMRQLFQTLRR